MLNTKAFASLGSGSAAPYGLKMHQKQRGSLVEINILFNLTINYISIAIASRHSRDAIGS